MGDNKNLDPELLKKRVSLIESQMNICFILCILTILLSAQINSKISDSTVQSIFALGFVAHNILFIYTMTELRKVKNKYVSQLKE